MKIAIIGAGLGGLTFGALAAKDGHEVTVYDKNEKPGGVGAVITGARSAYEKASKPGL